MTKYSIKPDVGSVKEKLNQRINDVVSLLLPKGKRTGDTVRVGDINGNEGKSMVVYMSGDKKGRFEDFATGDYGDLIDLWMHVKGMPSFIDAMKDVKNYLGISDDYELVKSKDVDISEEIDAAQELTPAMIKYLNETRKISKNTIELYKLCNINGRIVFPYYHEQKVRMYKALKVANGKNNWHQNNGDKMPCLFGWQSIKSTDREVVITEGEIDAMSYREQGIPALSVPNGAGEGKVDLFMKNEFPLLMSHFETFYISMDDDEAGRLMVPTLVRALGKSNCRIIDLPKIDGKKSDGNECHKNGIDLKYCVEVSKYQPEPGIINCSEAFDEAMKIFNDDITIIGKPLPWPSYEKEFRLRPSEVTIWAGYNSSGKSMLLSNIVLALGAMNEKCLVGSFEMKKGRTMHRLMRQANSGEKPDTNTASAVRDYLSKSIWLVDKQGKVETNDLLKKLSYAVARYGVTHLVIDPLVKCGMAEDDYSAQKDFVERLTDFAQEYDTHVHLVVHNRKGESEKIRTDKMNIKGTGAITDLADNVFTMFKNVGKAELIDMMARGMSLSSLDEEKRKKAKKTLSEPDFFLNCRKQRNGEWEGLIKLWFDNDTLQFKEAPNDEPIVFVNFNKIKKEVA